MAEARVAALDYEYDVIPEMSYQMKKEFCLQLLDIMGSIHHAVDLIPGSIPDNSYFAMLTDVIHAIADDRIPFALNKINVTLNVAQEYANNNRHLGPDNYLCCQIATYHDIVRVYLRSMRADYLFLLTTVRRRVHDCIKCECYVEGLSCHPWPLTYDPAHGALFHIRLDPHGHVKEYFKCEQAQKAINDFGGLRSLPARSSRKDINPEIDHIDLLPNFIQCSGPRWPVNFVAAQVHIPDGCPGKDKCNHRVFGKIPMDCASMCKDEEAPRNKPTQRAEVERYFLNNEEAERMDYEEAEQQIAQDHEEDLDIDLPGLRLTDE